jgi:hypothetical protein
LKFEISQQELNELLQDKFGATAEVKEGKLIVSAMMGTVKFTLFAPKTPLSFSKEVKLDISMSLTVRMFLGKIKEELKKRHLDDAISVTPKSLIINVGKIDNYFANWLKNKELKEIQLEKGRASLKIE